MKTGLFCLLLVVFCSATLRPPLDPYGLVGTGYVLIQAGNETIRQYSSKSAREISNAVSVTTEIRNDARELNMLAIVELQVMDHDIALTPTTDNSSWPIDVPEDDPHFGPFNVTSLPFTRTGRSPENHITPRNDCSFIYGSTPSRLAVLRQAGTAFMRVDENNLPPPVADSDIPVAGHPAFMQYACGDKRCSEQVMLTVLHSVWLREHNLQARRCLASGITDPDEAFECARNTTCAVRQRIVHEELLPSLIGPHATCDEAPGSGDPARLSNLFATAVYRAHTFISNETSPDLEAYGISGLRDMYFSPHILRHAQGNLAPFINSMYKTPARAADTMITDDLRNLLFVGQPDVPPIGHDLAALNVQRGRDTGVPTYNAVRRYLDLPVAATWTDITSDADTANRLASVYDSPDECDAWVCIYAEDRLSDSSLGETATKVVRDTLCSLRAGDSFFWSLQDDSVIDKQYVSKRHYTHVLCDNALTCDIKDPPFTGSGDKSETSSSGTAALVLGLVAIVLLGGFIVFGL